MNIRQLGGGGGGEKQTLQDYVNFLLMMRCTPGYPTKPKAFPRPRARV